MRSRAGSRALDGRHDSNLFGRLPQHRHIVRPARSVQVDRQQPAGLVDKERIDPYDLPALQVPEHLARAQGCERLVRTGAATHARLLAHSALPLVCAPRRITRPARRSVLPADGEHIVAPAEERTKQLNLTHGGPADRRTAVIGRRRTGVQPLLGQCREPLSHGDTTHVEGGQFRL